MSFVHADNEAERLEALNSLQILHSEQLPEYDAVVSAVAAIFNCPIALICFVGEKELWFKARCGLEPSEMPRDNSFCQHAILNSELFVVPDALADERFRDNPLVTGPPHFRFYAGCPLSIDGRNRLGTLCVLDREPHTPTEAQLEQLSRMGTVAEGLIKAHRARLTSKAALQEAEQVHKRAKRESDLLGEIANVSGVGGWELDIASNTLVWTDKTREIHEVEPGFTPSLELALSFYDQDSRPVFREALDRCISEGTGWDVELPFTTAKGRSLWIRSAGRPIFENGKLTRLVGAFQDITARKQSEQAVRYSEAVQRTTLKTLSEGILLVTRSGHIQSFNPAAAHLLGYAGEELRGLRLQDLELDIEAQVDDPLSGRELFDLTPTQPERIDKLTVRVSRPGAAGMAWLRVRARSISAASEFKLDGVVISLTDISEIKIQEEKLQAIFENFPGGIVYHDEEMRLTAYNETFRRMLKLPRAVIENRPRRQDALLYLAKRGDFGPGNPKEIVRNTFQDFNDKQPSQYERITADGRVLDTRAFPTPSGGMVFCLFDVTEKKRAEDAVKRSEAIHRTTLLTLQEGILLLSRSGQVQSVNPAALELLGSTNDDLTGMHVADVDLDIRFDVPGHSESVSPLELAARDPTQVSNAVVCVHPRGNGQTRWLKLNAKPIDTDSDYGLDGIVLSLTDVTETMRNLETLQVVFKNLPGGLVYYDEQHRLAVCNEDFERLLQLPHEFIQEQATLEEVAYYIAKRGDYGPGDPDRLYRERLELFKGPEPHLYERTSPDGTILEVRGIPLPNGGLVSSFFDITERKRSEIAIRQSEAVHRTTLKTLSEGILLLSHSGEILSANPAAVQLFGIADRKLTGLNVSDPHVRIRCEIEGEGDCENLLAMAAENPTRVSNLVACMRPENSGLSRWLRVNAHPVDQDSEFDLDGIVVSLTDITETKQQAETLQVLFDNFPGGFAHYDENLRLASCNSEFVRLLNYPQSFVDGKPTLFQAIRYNAVRGDYGPGDPDKIAKERIELYDLTKAHSYERSSADGSFIEIRCTPLPQGGVIYNFFDITDRKRMEAQLAENERTARLRSEELEAILSEMRQGVSVFDRDGRLTLWNQQYVDIFGKPEGEVRKGISLMELIEAEKNRGEFEGDVHEHVSDLLVRLSSGQVVPCKFEHPGGRIISSIHVPMPTGGWIGTHEDVTQREKAAQKIEFAAHHDMLTGLANRTLFNLRLEEEIAAAAATGRHGDLMLLDLDRFKPVNDRFGHDVGDELLKQVARRLKECVRSSDLIARLGGDEFGVLLSGTDAAGGSTAEVAERLVQKIMVPFTVQGHTVSIGVSIGIASVTGETDDARPILKRADVALYQVKEHGRNGYKFFDPRTPQEVVNL
ncbi:PAS-domain containing protein [Roseibium sp.]|uniref:PAS-domain containing protein n=1 Tax=Roseibium sp. TaxID=1936156 RepID=UPI003D11777F